MPKRSKTARRGRSRRRTQMRRRTYRQRGGTADLDDAIQKNIARINKMNEEANAQLERSRKIVETNKMNEAAYAKILAEKEARSQQNLNAQSRPDVAISSAPPASSSAASRIQATRDFNKQEREHALEARARIQSEAQARTRAEAAAKSQAELAEAIAQDKETVAKEQAQMQAQMSREIESLKQNVNENAGKMSREEAARVKADLMKRKTEYEKEVKEGEQALPKLGLNEMEMARGTELLNYFKEAANTMGELISQLDKAEVPRAEVGNEAWSRALAEEQAKAPNDSKLVLIDRVNRRLGIQGGKKRTMRKKK